MNYNTINSIAQNKNVQGFEEIEQIIINTRQIY